MNLPFFDLSGGNTQNQAQMLQLLLYQQQQQLLAQLNELVRQSALPQPALSLVGMPLPLSLPSASMPHFIPSSQESRTPSDTQSSVFRRSDKNDEEHNSSVSSKHLSSSSSSSSPSTSSVLQFDPESLTIDELRTELRLRYLSTRGTKPVIIKRLLCAVTVNPSLPVYSLSQQEGGLRIHKREPVRSDFASEKEFRSAWEQWRQSRNYNNESVKRSRRAAVMKKQEQEDQCLVLEQENAALCVELVGLRKELQLLAKVLRDPQMLTEPERSVATQLMFASSK